MGNRVRTNKTQNTKQRERKTMYKAALKNFNKNISNLAHYRQVAVQCHLDKLAKKYYHQEVV